MTIKYHDSLAVAQQITDKLMDDLRVLTLAMDVTITNYYNGREVGHALSFNTLDNVGKITTICYSETRGSDEIVVYPNGNYYNLPSISDEAYENAKYFKPSNMEGAVDFIIEQLLEADKLYIEREKEYNKKLGS